MHGCSAALPTRRLPVGAEVLFGGSVSFRIWAPRARAVTVEIFRDSTRPEQRVSIDLGSEGAGYFSGQTSEVRAGDRYGFRLDGSDELLPDPASRFQPDGPEGLSQLVDPGRFRWDDAGWRGVAAHGQVIYEMHVGTFTSAGTWQAAAAELEELARTGMTVVEIMPVAEFPGEFGWGYDGVCLFAPTRLYGHPDDFRSFVDRAHKAGLGVILDVVYNHFGPIGNTVRRFSDDYFTDRYQNEWGEALNFDGKNAASSREFFVTNVRYWIDEFHLDGLRFDATQTIYDQSEPHILAELAQAAREAAGARSVFLVAENERQNTRLVQRPCEKGYGLDALWNDDFHHSAMVRLTGHNEAYYSDYLGGVGELVSAIRHGFIYQGQRSRWQEQPRGTPSFGLPATAFVSFLQNHDQVANSAAGIRPHECSSPGRYRAMTALWLLSPQTPMFFQGQEFAASAPFLYFADHRGETARQVARGRAEFLSQFPTLATPEAQKRLPDPADPETFRGCRLDFSERQAHADVYRLHQDLLKLRRDDPVFQRQQADRIEGAPVGADCLLLRFFGDNGDDRLLLVNFGSDLDYEPAPQPLLAPPAERQWALLWSSNEAIYGGNGTPPVETDEGWHIPGEAAVVLTTQALTGKAGGRGT